MRLSKEKGFSLIELVVVVSVLSVLSAIAIPAFNCITNKAKATAALTALKQIKKECMENSVLGRDEDTFINPGEFNGYSINVSDPNNCEGISGLIRFNSYDTSVLPTLIYETNTDEIHILLEALMAMFLQNAWNLFVVRDSLFHL